jgi:hypothetical protein
MQDESNVKTAEIANVDLDYIKPRTLISGKKTLEMMLQQQEKVKRNEILNTLKILLVSAGLVSSIIFLIIFVLSKL